MESFTEIGAGLENDSAKMIPLENDSDSGKMILILRNQSGINFRPPPGIDIISTRMARRLCT